MSYTIEVVSAGSDLMATLKSSDVDALVTAHGESARIWSQVQGFLTAMKVALRNNGLVIDEKIYFDTDRELWYYNLSEQVDEVVKRLKADTSHFEVFAT
jgi:hypothetical protein